MVPSDDAQPFNTSNVRVIARVRPPLSPEEPGCVYCPVDNTLEVVSQEGSSPEFTFDKVHGLPNGASNIQADIFSDIQDIVLSPLEGRNGCVIAYGQKGSGKTYTMAGDLDSSTDQGLISRSINHMAQGISKINEGSEFQVYLSLVGISQDIAKDLVRFLPVPSDNTAGSSQAVQQYKSLGCMMTYLNQTSAKGELVDLTQQGLARQIVASVAASRSYVLINLTVERHLPDGSVKHGQLTLVKLTGTEKQDKILALALPLAMKGIAEGEARMALIICCSPSAADAMETLSSLHFGVHAKSIMTSMQEPPGGEAADPEESQQVPAVKTADDVKEDIRLLEASLADFIQKLMEVDEETRIKAPEVGTSAGMLMTQLTSVLGSLLQIGTKLHEESTGLLEAAHKEHEETVKEREEIASMLGWADAPVRPQANARAARPRLPLCFTMLDIVFFPAIMIGGVSLMVCMWMRWV